MIMSYVRIATYILHTSISYGVPCLHNVAHAHAVGIEAHGDHVIRLTAVWLDVECGDHDV